jgi:hypothetical protein
MYISPFLLMALVWMNQERKRLLSVVESKELENRDKDAKILSLSERAIALTSELKMVVFGKAA